MIVPVASTYLRYYRIFRRYTGRSMHALELFAIASANLDGLGIAAVVPLLSGVLSPTPTTVFGLGPGAALALVIALFTLKGAFRYAFAVYQARVNHRLASDLVHELSAALGRMDYRESLALDRGHLTNVMTNEVNRTAGAFVGLSSMVPSATSIAVSTVIAFFLHWRLALATLALSVGVLALSRTGFRLARRYSHDLTRRYSVLFGLLIQTADSFKYLRATGRFSKLEQRIGDEIETIGRVAVAGTMAGQLVGALLEPLVITFLAGMMYVESRSGVISLPALSALALLAYRIMNQVLVFQGAWQKFSSGLGSVDAVVGLLDRLKRAPASAGGERLAGFSQALELSGVGFAHGDHAVLEDVSISIHKNERVAFVGESGAGKSTLVDILTGLLAPTRGSLRVDGVDSRALDWDHLRSRIGYVPQEPALFNDTFEANIRFWDPVDAGRMSEAVRRARLGAVQTDMAARPDQGIGNQGQALSGGQRQRLALARELYREPEILILDEATSALDAESEEAILKTLDELRGRITIITVAHRLYTVRNCDRIFVMKGGRVVEQGRFADLIASEGSVFKRLYELQNV